MNERQRATWGRQTRAPIYAPDARQAVERLLLTIALSLETNLDWPEYRAPTWHPEGTSACPTCTLSRVMGEADCPLCGRRWDA